MILITAGKHKAHLSNAGPPPGFPANSNLRLQQRQDAAEDFDGSGLPAHLDVDPQDLGRNKNA